MEANLDRIGIVCMFMALVSVIPLLGCAEEGNDSSAVSQNAGTNTELELSSVFDWVARDEVPSKYERVFSTPNIKQLLTYGDGDRGDVLYRPGGVLLVEDSLVFIKDYGDLSVRVWDVQGNELGRVGDGAGDGPGEFYNPIDLSVDDSGNVYILDSASNRISKFDYRYRFQESTQLDVLGSAYRFSGSGDGSLFFVSSIAPEIGLQVVENGEALVAELPFSPKNVYESQTMVGNVERIGNRFLLIMHFYPVVIEYNQEGAMLGMYYTPDISNRDKTKPLTVSIPGGRIMRDSYLNGPTVVSGDKLYVLLRNAEGAAESSHVDVYDVSSGVSYLNTLQLPFKSRYFSIGEKYLLSQNTDTTIVLFTVD